MVNASPTARFTHQSPVRTVEDRTSCMTGAYARLPGNVVHSALAVVEQKTILPSPRLWTVIAGSAAAGAAAFAGAVVGFDDDWNRRTGTTEPSCGMSTCQYVNVSTVSSPVFSWFSNARR